MPRPKIRDPQAFASGLLFLFFGIVTLVVGSGYRMGSAVQMGPGYFPLLLGSLLSLFGILVLVPSILVDGPAIERSSLGGAAGILLSIMVFAALIVPAGLAIAVFAMVLVARLPAPGNRILSSLILAAALSALAVVLFIWLLALPIAPWPF